MQYVKIFLSQNLIKLKKPPTCYWSYSPYFNQFVFILAVVAYTNSASKIHKDLGFSISEKEILWAHTQTSTVLFEKEKKSQTLLQNTVYTVFQSVFCISYTMQVTPSTWVIYIKLPADGLVACASACAEAQQC